MRYKKTMVAVGTLGIIAVVCSFLASGCGRPKVAIEASRDQEGRLIVDLRPDRRVIGISGIMFWAEGDNEYLWILRSGQGPVPSHVVYGKLPPGVRQTHPAGDMLPRPIPDSGIIYVGVDYRWDSTLPPAAAISSSAMKFQLSKEGAVSPLGEAGLGEGLMRSENSRSEGSSPTDRGEPEEH